MTYTIKAMPPLVCRYNIDLKKTVYLTRLLGWRLAPPLYLIIEYVHHTLRHKDRVDVSGLTCPAFPAPIFNPYEGPLQHRLSAEDLKCHVFIEIQQKHEILLRAMIRG